MTTTEMLAVIIGLVAGYWIISRVIASRTPRPERFGGADEATVEDHHTVGPTGGRVEDLNPEWIRANWHEVLGVSPKASIEVIKSAYRLRAHQYHPDKTEGLGPELKALAARKMHELNMAYTWATRSGRGR